MENTLGKISKNILEKLEFLKCPICLDIVENARELPCRHIFCSDCLDTYKKENDTLLCPLCKKEISKRKLLSRDTALDTYCCFVKTLCNDVKVQHNSDIKTFFTNVFNKETLINNFKALSESEEIIPQSSEENIIPCTSKPNEKKKFIKKKNLSTLKLGTKNVPKQINHDSKKTPVKDGKRKTQPKLGLSRKQSNVKVNNSVPFLKPNLEPQHKQSLQKPCSDKTKILQWLHDTRNKFERFSQTQNCDTQINTPQDVDMPSVSQIFNKKQIDPKECESAEKQLTLIDNKETGCKRANSLENLIPSEGKKLRRHSLECTSPNKMKRYKNLQEIDNIENQLIIDIIEDEVLDVIDKEVSGENNKKKTPLSSRKPYNDENMGVTNTKENEFLDQLDDEMLGNCVNTKTKSKSKNIDLNSTEVGKENKSKSSWKSIKKFKKTIGKTKVPKRLDISLQSTQRSNKKETESRLSEKSSNVMVLDNKTVDFQKMEDYFSKAIPQMIQNNMNETVTSEKSNEDIYHKDNKSNEKMIYEESKLNDKQEKDNDSDIYIYQTQPLSNEILDPKIDKISYAAKLMKKLDNVLKELTNEDNVKIDELSSLLPSIKSIFKIFDQFGNKDKWTSPEVCNDKIQICLSEKQVQTDVFSLEGFPITPSAAFKSLIHEDVGTQTDNFCYECPHSYSEKIISTSPLIRSESGGQSRRKDSFEKGTLNESVMEGGNLAVKSQKTKAHMLEEPSSVKKMKISHEPSIDCFSDEKVELMIPSPRKQFSDTEGKNPNTNVPSNSQTFFGQASLPQFNSCTSNTSKIDTNNSICKVTDNKNESKLNTSQASAIMCSLPRSNSGVNRRLMFEKTLKERKELEQTLKRVRSENMSDSDDERPHKMKCNRFLQDDISIEFESESLNDNIVSLRNSDVLISQRNDDSANAKNNSMSCQNSKNETCYNKTQNFEESIQAENNKNETLHKKTQNMGEFTQADTLLNYCDDLIEKANRQISLKNVLSEHNDGDLSQILSKTTNNFQENEKFNLSVNKEYLGVKTQQVNEKIKTQDLLKHYDELIDKANKQIEMENTSPNVQHKETKYHCSQIPTTSKHLDVSDSNKKVQEPKSQDLLDRYNALIEKTTKEIAQNEMKILEVEEKNNKVQHENDDDFFCQNLDQLDSVLEKENKKLNPKEKLSESLFDTCKENLHDISDIEKKAMAEILEELHSTPKRRKSVTKEEKVKKSSKTNLHKSDGFNSSDDEIFSDVDVVETTPQKSLSFVERISCSQVVNQNSRMSLKFQENSEQFPASVNIVPPPPGFDDDDDKMEEKESEKMSNSERESENVIPNSLSPQKFELPPPRRPLTTSCSKKSITTLSQQCMKVSPICPEKSKNLNVIEMVRQSKFSPLTIVPKPTSSVLTSTPKQKSILSYTKAKPKISQEVEPSIPTREKSKPCIAFSRLSNAETLCVLTLCNKKLATRQDKFGPEVSHMIVSVDKRNHLKDHTIKFISAIAAGIWVVNIKWVQECLAKNYIVDEEPYEVLDITGTPSPRISRLNRLTNPLLRGFRFFIPRSFAQTSAEEVKNIITLLQGEVVSSVEELVSSDREEYTCIIISELVDTEDYTQYESWLMTHKLLTVDINWLSLSVSRYKILSLRPHLICSDDSIDELGYPSNLVVDVAPTLTQDVSVYD